MLQELSPGIHMWDSKDLYRYRAFALVADGEVVLIDPVRLNADEEAQIRALGTVTAILVAWGDMHERDSAKVSKRFGAPVYAHPDAVLDCESKDVLPFPDVLPMGIEALPATGGGRGHVAFYLERDGGTLYACDTWMNFDLGKEFFPIRWVMKTFYHQRDGLNLMPPHEVTDMDAWMASSRAMLNRPIERLLVSHGDCILSGARDLMLERRAKGP